MYAEVGGERLFYDVIGTGPPVLVMHGGMGFDHSYLRPWLDPLADSHTLVYYDHRGNGRSSRPQNWGRVTHGTWADDAAAVLNHLGFERAAIFGHSYGGFIALELVVRHPGRVGRLILCDAAPALDYPHVVMSNAQARGTPQQVAAVGRALTEGVVDDDDLRELMRTILSIYFEGYPPGRFEQVLGRTVFSAEAMNHAFRTCVATYDVRPHLSSIRVATTILVGRHDWICPVEEGSERIRAAVPSATMKVFERSGHFPFVEEQDAFLQSVREALFLES